MQMVKAQADTAPKGWVLVHVPGVRPSWAEPGIAAHVGELCARNKLDDAKVLMLWMGAEEEGRE